jgi:8-oxo-dGTP pyrophosphatase MutT (NUDIX family)
MNLEYIKNKLSKRRGKPLGIIDNYAVLVPLLCINDEVRVLFQVRSYNLDVQPGEVCFPGGKVEQGESFQEAAVRETHEELGINRDNIEVIGKLDYVVTPYNFNIYPFVGILQDVDINKININKDEVEEIFTVPINFFKNTTPLNYFIKLKTEPQEDFPFNMIENGRDYKWRTGTYPVYFYQYKDYTIWGMTARITKNFIDIISD